MNGLLAGVRVIAIEQFGAGPFATLQLCDMGAEVIKVEDPSAGGDVGRYIPPGQSGSDSLYFETFNRGKRSIAIDLKSQSGREVFERLVKTADVVFNNLRGDLARALELDYEHLGSVNPGVVAVSLSAYGRGGPRANEPGYDALIQAETGWAALTGDPDDPPTKSGLSLVDYAAGLAASFAMTAGLLDSRRTGRGRAVDVSLYDIGLACLTYPATWFLSAGFVTERQPRSAHPSIVPFQFFETLDGHVAIVCGKEKFFRNLAPAIGLPGLPSDSRFNSMAARLENRAELIAILSRQFRERTTHDWLHELRGKVPAAPVRSLPEALSVEQLRERGLLAEYIHATLGLVRGIGSPLLVESYAPTYKPAPGLGADRDELLSSLGYAAAEIEALKASGAFGSTAKGQHTEDVLNEFNPDST